MFDHLDDPEGLGPVDRWRDDVVRSGRRRRRARRLLWSGASVVAVVGATAIAAYAYVDRKVDQVDRVRVANLAPEPPRSEPYVVLFRGLDDASGFPANDQLQLGRVDVEGRRADTIVLARIDPGAELVTMMALPRDLVLAGPDGLPTRIATLGLDDTVAALRGELGIEVHRVVETDLAGAVAIGDALGGLRLAFDQAVRDPRAGLALDGGCNPLSGRAALAVARSRHLERYDGMRWVADPAGDLGRIARQQEVFVAGLRAFSHLDPRDPAAVNGFLDAVADHVAVDADVSKGELLELFRDLAGSQVRRLTLPTANGRVGDAEVLELGEGAASMIDRFLEDDPVELDPQHRGTAELPPAGAVVPTPC
jgi:LCP family protein required for cell wall assembly